MLCIADHFEPGWRHADAGLQARRVQRWVEQYPALFDGFRDADGRPPRHTFFYPIEQYRPEHLDGLAPAGGGRASARWRSTCTTTRTPRTVCAPR